MEHGVQPARVLAGITGDGADCTLLSGEDDFCTTSNKADVTAEPLWGYDSTKSGKTIHYYQTSAFIEGGINLGAIPGAGQCFPSFLAETRSSSRSEHGLSLDAQLKDLAFGQFQLCGSTDDHDAQEGRRHGDGRRRQRPAARRLDRHRPWSASRTRP